MSFFPEGAVTSSHAGETFTSSPEQRREEEEEEGVPLSVSARGRCRHTNHSRDRERRRAPYFKCCKLLLNNSA